MDDKTIHLLLVEDNLTDVLLLEESLAEVRAPEIVVTRVERLAEALQHMEKEEYSIVLLDLGLPDSNGLETFIKLYQAQTKTPILVLTGLDDEKIGLRAIQEGAQDYLVKGQMTGHALARIIRYAIERKQAENLIRISEANLAQAQRIAHLGSWEMDLLPAGNFNGSTLRWSDEVFRIFGYEPGEIEVSNENFFRAVHPDDRERITAMMTQAVGEGKAYRLDHRILLPGGEERIVQEQAQIVFDPDTDKPARMVGTVQDITERKQAEALLRESEDRFSGAFEHAPIGVALVSPDGQWLKVNTAVCDLLGYSEAELLALTFQDITYPEDLDLDLGNVRRMLAGEIQAYEMEKRYIHRSGHLITALSGVSLVRDDHGAPRYFISHIRDITERKQAEDALRASQQQFQSIVANVPGMVYQFVLQPDGSVEWPFVSEGCRELYEVEPEIIQRNPLLPFEAVHPDDIAGINNSIAESAQALLPFSWEGRLRTPSGRNKWVQYASRPQRLPNGGTLWDGLLMDITARKEAEEERDRFFTLSPDMMSIGSTDGYFKRLNPAFEVTLGYSIEELMSKHFLEFVHPDDRAVTQAQTDNLILGLRVTQFENRYRCRDGSYKWLRWMCVSFEDLIYSVAHDITEVKKAEAAWHKANDELELRVMERTVELEVSNQEMYAAKQEADTANAAKSEFLSRMSHELRTPLNAILGFGQVLEMRGLSTRDSECVGHIVQGGRHLLGLINEVLDIARVEAGHISLSIEPVDISQVLRETLDLVTLLGEQQGIRFDLGNSQSCQSTVRADRQRLKQVLINLLSNAVKYNRPGGSVSISCLPAGTEYTRIEVRDSGQGIAPEDLQKMFVPFERLGAESSQIEGTGLGLVLCLRLVEAMGGTLEAQSVVGEGSTFSIVLPRMDAPMPQLQTTAADTQKLHEITATTKTKTVLAIEDNPANYSLLEVILESRPNVRLVGCAQGSIGLDLARRHQPDLILLDLHLPDMEGSEVLRRLLEAPETREIPIIVVSADATPPQVERMLQAGARSYLTKPLNVAEFLRIVDEMREEEIAKEAAAAVTANENATSINL